MAADERVLRLRCRKDLTDRSEPQLHYAMDVRLPLQMVALGELLQSVGNCVCGAEMVILGDTPDTWVRDTSDHWIRTQEAR